MAREDKFKINDIVEIDHKGVDNRGSTEYYDKYRAKVIYIGQNKSADEIYLVAPLDGFCPHSKRASEYFCLWSYHPRFINAISTQDCSECNGPREDESDYLCNTCRNEKSL